MRAAVWRRPLGGGQPLDIVVLIGSVVVLFLRLAAANRICITTAQRSNRKRFKNLCAF